MFGVKHKYDAARYVAALLELCATAAPNRAFGPFEGITAWVGFRIVGPVQGPLFRLACKAPVVCVVTRGRRRGAEMKTGETGLDHFPISLKRLWVGHGPQ